MHLLYFSGGLICALLSTTATAAAIPQVDDGLGAQLADDLSNSFRPAVPFATITQRPPAVAQTPLPDFRNQTNNPPVKLFNSQSAKLNSSDIVPTPTRTPFSKSSATAPAEQDNSLEAQSPDAVNHVFDASTNTTSINIPIVANTTSPPPPIQDNGLMAQDTNPLDTAFSPKDNSTINTDPQPINESIIQESNQGDGNTTQQPPQQQQQQQQTPQDNGLQAQPNTTDLTSPPQTTPAKLSTAINPHPTTSPTPPTSTSTPSTTTAQFIPQDNGLEAQDVSGENDDFSPQTNQTSVNDPHQFHDPRTGELLLPVVQDDGLQAQDSGGANVVWSAGETYDGGMGGEINVPTAVNGGPADQR